VSSWKCSKCEYLHENVFLMKCSMCNEPRQIKPEYVSQLVCKSVLVGCLCKTFLRLVVISSQEWVGNKESM